jgi:hypothetical protein
MELLIDNPAIKDPAQDTPVDDSAFAATVFADPVRYLASLGINSRLVTVTGMSIPKAA